MKILVFHESAQQPSNVRAYCTRVAEAKLGRGAQIAETQLVATRPGKNLDVPEALGVYQRLVELGRVSSFGRTSDAWAGSGPDGARVVALLF